MTYRNPIICLIVATLALVATDAAACSCIEATDPVAAASEKDAVFRGRVLASVMVLINEDGSVVYKDGLQTPHGHAQRVVVFRVDEIFKGSVPPLTTLVTGSGGGDCGYPFENETDYVVFANVATEERAGAVVESSCVLTTSICSSTQPAKAADKLRASLAKKFGSRQPVWIASP